jgi:hypothetical protein
MSTVIRHPNGGRAPLHHTALHRRNRDGPSDWMAQAGSTAALGRTRDEATARLILTLVAPLPSRGGISGNFITKRITP